MKTIYNQRNNLWASEKLGLGVATIGSHGCKLTSFAMLDGRTPHELNELFKREGCFSGDLLYDERCASTLGWGLQPRTYDKPSVTPCIAEVDMSPDPGRKQHFVVWQGDTILDPWTGAERPSTTYPVVSFRNFIIKEDPMKKEFVKAIEKITGERYGDNINEKEQADAAKKIEEVSDKMKKVVNLAEERMKELVATKAELENEKYHSKAIEETNRQLEQRVKDLEAAIGQIETDSIDAYSLTELAGAFFRKLTSIKK